jgi:hypothetical protein
METGIERKRSTMIPDTQEVQDEDFDHEAYQMEVTDLAVAIDRLCDGKSPGVVIDALVRQAAMILIAFDREDRLDAKHELFRDIDAELQWLNVQSCDA